MPEGTNPQAQLWKTLYQLKALPRTGWVDRGIPAAEVESVADHSYFSMLIAWVVAYDDDSIDANKVLQLALIHDAAEAIAGDIPPYDPEDIPTDPEFRRAFFSVRLNRTPENKARKDATESAAAEEILAMLPESVRVIWEDLWQEYAAQKSSEARLVKQVDKLEAFIQSRLYAEEYPDAPVIGFTDMARQAIDHPLLIPIRDAFLAEID